MDSPGPIVRAVVLKFNARSVEGMDRYGQTMAANNKPTLEWIEDTQEELMDAIPYLERLKREVEKQKI